MKVSYLVPENYRFLRSLIPYLQDNGVEVEVNKVSEDADLIFPPLLPCVHGWLKTIEESSKPTVLWNWDLFSFVDLQEERWVKFLNLMKRREAEVWSCSYETARQLKEQLEIDSRVIPAWIDGELLRSLSFNDGDDYVFYAASCNSIGKRLDWAKKACSLAGFNFEFLTAQKLPYDEYLKKISRCRVYLMTAFEESNGSIPAMEAAAAGRALVVADIPSNREVFGNTVYYFPVCDFGVLIEQLKNAWHNGPLAGCQERMLRNYSSNAVFPRILSRLKELMVKEWNRSIGKVWEMKAGE